jgi:hypothetical protein
MQCGKCVRDLLRNLMLLSSGRMSHTFTLIMKAADWTETSVYMYWTTRRHIPANSNPHSHHHANFESGTHNFWFKLNLILPLECLRLAMLRSELKDWRLVCLPVTNVCSQEVDLIWSYICYMQFGCHPVAEVQYKFTHKQYVERYKTNNT